MRIPITMSHGINPKHEPPLDAARFEEYFRIAAEMGFQSVSYEQLDGWMNADAELPERPIMFDFDHPSIGLYTTVQPIMDRFDFRANLFINTKPMEELYAAPIPPAAERKWMTWDEIGVLIDAGWHIGAHTHTHPNLSKLCLEDPTGEALRVELETNDGILERELGITPKDFAFTGTTWSGPAEKMAKERYRFGRLWITGAMYNVDGGQVRYAELVNVPGEDEADGGPPHAARYITKDSDPYRLPSIEIECLIYEFDAFREYLEKAGE